MEDNFNKHLGNKLKLRRLALGLTQTKVAKAINVTFQQIQKYEKGTNGVSSIRLLQLANFLKVPVNYFFEDLIEAGIVLKGSEIKSIRDGKVNIADSYAVEKNGELILINSHIASYKQASYSNHNPVDDRKLLLNKREINKLIGKMQRDGFTIVPTKMYFKKGKAKIELAVAKGKKQFDKRATKKNRDWNRDKARYIRKSS